MGQNPAHILPRIFIPARRRSRERIDNNDIRFPPVQDRMRDGCRLFRLKHVRSVRDDRRQLD